MEQAIADGPEALQKYIDSGEIEELQDVMPIKDDNEEDYLIDPSDKEAAQSGGIPATTGVVTQNVPTSFGHSDNDFWLKNANKNAGDDDMRMELDFGNNQGQDEFRSRDIRNQGNILMQDKDFRQYNHEFIEDDEFGESYEDNKDYDEEFFEETGNWQRNNQSNQFGANRHFRGPPPNLRGAGNFNRSERNFGPKDGTWNNAPNNFRVPDGFRGLPNERFRGPINNDNFRPSNNDNFRGGPLNNDSFRGGPPNNDNFRSGPNNTFRGPPNDKFPGGPLPNSENFRGGPPPNGDNFRSGPLNSDNFRVGPPPNSDNFRGGPPPNSENFRNGPPSNGDNFRGPPASVDNFRNGPLDDNFRGGPPNSDNFRGQRGRRGPMRGGPRGGRSRGRGGPDMGRGRGPPRRGGPNRGGF